MADIRYLKVICGSKTCYSFEDNIMCRFVRTRRMGKVYVCGLYWKNEEEISLKGHTTALERCDQCIEELG